MHELTYTTIVNAPLLDLELKAAFSPSVISMAYNSDGYLRVFVDDAVDIETAAPTIDAIVDTHDPAQLTPQQVAVAEAATAPDRALAIPGWATWDEATAIAYIENNVVNLDSAKTVLVAMARIIVALRDHTWPGLGGA